MNKKTILISLSIIFLSASAVGIGWIVKKEMEKGKQEQMQSPDIPKESGGFKENKKEDSINKNSGNDENVVVSNKNEANKALDDMDAIVNSMGNDLTN
jgi:hypothetical protein